MMLEWLSGSLWSKVSLAVSGALILALGVLWTYHVASNALLSSELESKLQKVGVLQASNASMATQISSLKSALSDQNQKVESLVISAALRSKEADEAVRKAMSQSQKWKVEYDRIINSAPATADDCQSASIQVQQYFDARSREARP